MSRAAKLTLACTTTTAAGIVAFVHYAQQTEKAVSKAETLQPHKAPNLTPLGTQKAMHAGVIRDVEQQRIKKERLADLQMQQALEKEYRKIQSVSGGGAIAVAEDSGSGR